MSTIPTGHHSASIDRALRTEALVRVRTGLNSIIELIALWRRRAAARRELQVLCELDDYILRDIGLTRTELRDEATRPFWRASSWSATTPRYAPSRTTHDRHRNSGRKKRNHNHAGFAAKYRGTTD